MSPLMWCHVVTGALAVIAGGIALIATKGHLIHRRAGKVFVASMFFSSLAGAFIALFLPNQRIAFFAGALTCYLILTSWLAVQHRFDRTSVVNVAMLFCACIVGSALLLLGFSALMDPAGLMYGYRAGPYFFLASVALLSAAFDYRVVTHSQLPEARRIARHLWRMCFAFFIAAGSLFTGPGAVAFPEFVRNSGVLSLPEPLIILTMIFWLVRTLWMSRKDRNI